MDAYDLATQMRKLWGEEYLHWQDAAETNKEKILVPVYVYTDKGAVKVKSIGVDPTLGIMLELEDGKEE
jgi:hypothetical protein